MNEVLKTTVSLSVSGTLLMTVLFLVRMMSKKWTSKRWRYYIWLFIITRLLLPFSPETSIVGNVFEQTDAYVEQIKVKTQDDKPPLYIIPGPIQTEMQTADTQATNTFQWKNIIEFVTQNL